MKKFVILDLVIVKYDKKRVCGNLGLDVKMLKGNKNLKIGDMYGDLIRGKEWIVWN